MQCVCFPPPSCFWSEAMLWSSGILRFISLPAFPSPPHFFHVWKRLANSKQLSLHTIILVSALLNCTAKFNYYSTGKQRRRPSPSEGGTLSRLVLCKQSAFSHGSSIAPKHSSRLRSFTTLLRSSEPKQALGFLAQEQLSQKQQITCIQGTSINSALTQLPLCHTHFQQEALLTLVALQGIFCVDCYRVFEAACQILPLLLSHQACTHTSPIHILINTSAEVQRKNARFF